MTMSTSVDQASVTSALGTAVTNDVTYKLSQLQDLCKRDPVGYRVDFDGQVRRLRSECAVLEHAPPGSAKTSNVSSSSSSSSTPLAELIQFAAAVSSSSKLYREEGRATEVARLLVKTLTGHTHAPVAVAVDVDGEGKAAATTKNPAGSALVYPADGRLDVSRFHGLDRDLRRTIVSALILMRNKGALDPLDLIHLCFRLLGATTGTSTATMTTTMLSDKVLRKTLQRHVVTDLRNLNHKGRRDDRINREVQSYVHRLVDRATNTSNLTEENDDAYDVDVRPTTTLSSSSSAPQPVAAVALGMVCELYRRRVGGWVGHPRVVSILERAVRCPVEAVCVRALKFFLGIEDRMEDDRQNFDREELERATERVDYHKFSRKTRKRQNQVKKQVKAKAKVLEQRRRRLQGIVTVDGENVSAGGTGVDPLLAGLADGSVVGENDGGRRRGKGARAKDRERQQRLETETFPSIELLLDPQGTAEHVLRRIKGSNANSNGDQKVKFSTKLLLLNFVTRLVGNHGLLLLPLYPTLGRFLGGHQKDVTLILTYVVQACHDQVPPTEVAVLLKTIAHNFVTERCTEEQMAVGINACTAICARVPSVLLAQDRKGDDDYDDDAPVLSTLDSEAFARDLAAYANHRDRSVATAGKTWTNLIRRIHPSLLAGKDRGSVGKALYRAGQRPMAYGQTEAHYGVEGADLLLAYEQERKEWLQRKKNQEDELEMDEEEVITFNDNENMQEDEEDAQEDENFDDVEQEEEENLAEMDEDEDESAGPEIIEEDSEEDEDEGDDEAEDQGDNMTAMDATDEKEVIEKTNSEKKMKTKKPRRVRKRKRTDEDDEGIDLNDDGDTETSTKERNRVLQEVSSTRIFTAEDFVRMRKLVEREKRWKSDPRAAAQRKRALAENDGFIPLSDDDNDSDDALSDDDDGNEDAGLMVHGVVDPTEIMAVARKKRMNKMARLEKVVAGRSKFEAKARAGGSTDTEKIRKKNFVMTKFSTRTRKKMAMKGVGNLKRSTKKTHNRQAKMNVNHKKRRRKM